MVSGFLNAQKAFSSSALIDCRYERSELGEKERKKKRRHSVAAPFLGWIAVQTLISSWLQLHDH
jgi:hypothetical protein